jgi:hypothetical protein
VFDAPLQCDALNIHFTLQEVDFTTLSFMRALVRFTEGFQFPTIQAQSPVRVNVFFILSKLRNDIFRVDSASSNKMQTHLKLFGGAVFVYFLVREAVLITI